MSLPQARAALNARLNSNDFLEFVTKDWKPTAHDLIWKWWIAYKDSEKLDNFNKAFFDSRLTMRTWSDVVEKSHTLRLAGNRIWDGKGGPHAEKGTKLMDDFDNANYKFNVGLESLKLRTTPENFFPGSGKTSKKYDLGLHDMSCSLVDHTRAISEQSHMKDNGTIFSFAAVADPEDQVIFHKLNRAGKALNKDHLEFYDLVREFRSKMTRIKLAAEHDMGTGFTAVRRENGPHFQLKYGLGYTTKIIDEKKTDFDKKFGGKLGGGSLGTGVRVTDTMRLARQEAALDYKSILARQLFAKNEVTVAIRHHDGPFPIFAVYNAPKNCFDCFALEGQKKEMSGTTISDTPVRDK